MENEHKKLLVIGLDGATYDVLRPLATAGYLPNLSRMMANGIKAELDSTIPHLSATAWTAFLTGKTAGKNGIFHFFKRDQKGQIYTQASSVVNGSSIRTYTLWDWLSKYGYRIISVNVPMTYPPHPINGLLITGMLTPPGSRSFTYPSTLVDSLEDYVVDLDYFQGEDQFDISRRPEKPKMVQDLTSLLISRVKTSVQLMENEPWDCFMVVFTGTDRLGHHFWEQMHNILSEDPLTDAVRSYFSELDSALGRLLKTAGDDVPVLILSDHGMGAIPTRQVNLADWLVSKKLTKMEGRGSFSYRSIFKAMGFSKEKIASVLGRFLSPSALDKITAHSVRVQPKVNINESQAVLIPVYESVVGIDVMVEEKEEHQRLVDQICSELYEIIDNDTGKAVVKTVHRRQDLFKGPYSDLIPDILVLLEPEYKASVGLGHRNFVTSVRRSRRLLSVSGSHRPKGIFIGCGYPFRKLEEYKEPFSIIDVLPNILYILGAPIPDDLDGNLSLGLFEQDYIDQHHAEYVTVDEELMMINGTAAVINTEDEENIRNRLRNLGYL